ncbi:hypothetical protein NEUTE1DRAFT_91606 [Neurospora tetrasperma FGSC 2508]|uniref:Ribosomal protein L9 domain-containing protein n=1 Tax=Neurospora tetrasperma (strain FGSC 2508 / ATCC MYA-4615 / P0657) TaxID=510951 RepID=F8MZH0_NEUT8|nr:uncharacterized protein NEUTE1DRAFT_91606 [Neurospora tetrasperma FGSC 2508]EGO52860.1 hypothetical protein NEUTE1DRAFT_91606 [Neurospora tetrasperma FGSC 2508]
MTASALSKWPTCLACLRRLAQPFGTSAARHGEPRARAVPVIRPIVHIQTRAASHRMRLQDQGVVVRLLEDIPKFGRKHAIFRIERGRMRNEWFPKNKAEYMTPARFQELGLTRDAIGEVDRSFVILSALEAATRPKPEEQKTEEPVPEVQISQVNVPDVTPETAHALLSELIPNTLTFHREPVPIPISKPKPALGPKISPLIARHVPASTPETPSTGEARRAIFGSVSSSDILNQIKALVSGHEEASRIILEPSSVKIGGLAEDNDRIRHLGRWEIEIAVARAGGLDPVRKSVEILPSAQ